MSGRSRSAGSLTGQRACVSRTSSSDSIPCGPDLDAIVEAVSAYWKAGFTDVALVQVGGDTQEEFLETAAAPLLERLRGAAP